MLFIFGIVWSFERKDEPPESSSAPRSRSLRHQRSQRRLAPASQGLNASESFRFALITDSHVWPRSHERRAFIADSDGREIRDGLLVAHSQEVYGDLLSDMKSFAKHGGAFAIHAGDAVCGGASFHASGPEFEGQLRAVAAAEHKALPSWPIHHVPGNHDLHPTEGGLAAWAATLGNSSGATAVAMDHGPDRQADRDGGRHYWALRRDGWRILLLDSASAVGVDTDGHGHVDDEQLRWLEWQLERSSGLAEHVIIVTHQLLVPPTDRLGGGRCPWFVHRYDMVDNADAVLSVMSRFDHVVLCLHGHVHANSLTRHRGVAFVTTAAADEYPMMWREVIVRHCDVELTTRALPLPRTVVEQSALRDTRGFNDAKRGDTDDNHVVLRVRRCGREPRTGRPEACCGG